MTRVSGLLLFLVLSQPTSSQTTWFSDQFSRTELGSQWNTASGTWQISNGVLGITTSDYDLLLSSDCYVYSTLPFSLETTLRGKGAGVYFSLDTRDSKSVSHMVRFDGKNVLTGYMNATGEYTATNVFEAEEIPTEWTTLRIDVDPDKRRYEVLVNGKLVGVDEHLVYGSGFIGLQASDGLSEFKSVKVLGKGMNTAPGRPEKGSVASFRHVGYVQAIGKNLAIYNPERGMMQTLTPEGTVIHESVLKMKPEPSREVMAGERRYSIEGKRILITNESGAVVDSITERLVSPSCILTDYALVRQMSPSIFVADPGANAIHQFSLTGLFLKSFTASSIGGLIAPRCIDFYGNDEIVIADYDRLVFIKKNLEDIRPEVFHESPTDVRIAWNRLSSSTPSIQYSMDDKTWRHKVGTGDSISNTALLTGLQPLTRYSFKVTPTLRTIPSDRSSSRKYRFTTLPADSSMMALARLRVLCMVYRTISYRDVYPKEKYPQIPDGRTITDDELTYLREACKFNTEFYFRNSSCKVVLDFDFYVVQDTLWLHELGDKDPYWLSCNERVTREYEKAVQHFGRTPAEYDGLVCPYAWVNHPPRRKSALSDPTRTDSINIRQAYGGGTNGVPAPWKYGKTTGYTGNPFQDKFSRQDWLITHEFHHQIDALMEASGYPEYYHADQPWKMPGRFGEDFDFNAHIIRNANPDSWLNLKFGTLTQTKDSDHDGVPDDDPSLPFDEKRLGGDSTKEDSDGDGLSDLKEVMAGTSRGSRLNIKDTDLDGVNDGLDPEPLYSITPLNKMKSDNPKRIRANMFGSAANVYASVSHVWNDSALSYIFILPDTANILVQIDANNDGWFHGFDNFQVRINVASDSMMVIDCYLRDCSSWVDPPKDRKDILPANYLHLERRPYLDGYGVVTLTLPRVGAFGLHLYAGKKIAVRFGAQLKDDRWVWDELFERNYMMQVELK